MCGGLLLLHAVETGGSNLPSCLVSESEFLQEVVGWFFLFSSVVEKCNFPSPNIFLSLSLK